jgi:acetyl-CoA acyltransferase
MTASLLVETGDTEIVIAGGGESMTRAPWVLPKPAKGYPPGNETLVSTTLGWRLVNPAVQAEWTVSLGEANELLQERFRISRDRQDAFAVRSHQLAARGWDEGFYDPITVPVAGLTRDESIRADTNLESLAKLTPSFRQEGTITAGNASPLSDGASAVLIATQGSLGGQPLARIAGRAAVALQPQTFGYAPVAAADQALARAGIGWDDVGAVELNEAFAVQSLACIDAWGIDRKS